MGQRFQAYYLMTKKGQQTNREELHREAFHLQWSWGLYSLMRLGQVMEFMTKQLPYEYTPFHARASYDLESHGIPILEALTGMNYYLGSYVEPYREDEDVAKDPGRADNNDGFFIVDLREDIPRYRLFANDWDCGFKAVTPKEYLGYYPDHLEKKPEATAEILEALEQYEMISDEIIAEVYPMLVGNLR